MADRLIEPLLFPDNATLLARAIVCAAEICRRETEKMSPVVADKRWDKWGEEVFRMCSETLRCQEAVNQELHRMLMDLMNTMPQRPIIWPSPSPAKLPES